MIRFYEVLDDKGRIIYITDRFERMWSYLAHQSVYDIGAIGFRTYDYNPINN